MGYNFRAGHKSGESHCGSGKDCNRLRQQPVIIGNMKRKLITLTALSALALGSSVLANDPSDAGNNDGGRRFRHSPIERMTDDLNLTADQKAKIQPIMDQARPQLEAIHREAMEKTRAVLENVKTQIRPLLTAEQQKKLDEAKNNRWGHRHHARHQSGDDNGNDDGGDQ